MSAIYTVVPVGGIVESAHPPVASRVARERLVAIMQEVFLKHHLIASFTVLSNREFRYPGDTPDILKPEIRAFFPERSLDQIGAELEYLYVHSVDEKRMEMQSVSTQLLGATHDEVIALYSKYHYIHGRDREYFESSVAILEKNWGDWETIKDDLLSLEYNHRAHELERALKNRVSGITDVYFRDLEILKAQLAEKNDTEAHKRVLSLVHDWCRKHVSKFENVCGDEQFYGAGYYVARMLTTDEPHYSQVFKDIYDALNAWQLPYFEVPL